jgi:hypothetical protein
MRASPPDTKSAGLDSTLSCTVLAWLAGGGLAFPGRAGASLGTPSASTASAATSVAQARAGLLVKIRATPWS